MHAYLKWMSSTSIRVPDRLLERLHEAQVPGASLARAVETAVEMAGGPAAIRRELDAERRRAASRAQVARLLREGHHSVVLEPGEQLTLAEGVRRRLALEEERGDRRLDPETGTLVLSSHAVSEADSEGGTGREGPLLGDRLSGGSP